MIREAHKGKRLFYFPVLYVDRDALGRAPDLTEPIRTEYREK